MSVPTTEIPQATQDALRARVDASVWGRLDEETRDRVMREMNGMAYARPHLDEYLELFNTTMTGQPSRFGELTRDEQRGVLDVATLRPGQGDVSLLREVIDIVAPSRWSPAVRGAVIDYMAWPVRAPLHLPGPARQRVVQWRAGQHAMRLTALVEVLRHPEFASQSDEVRLKIVTVMDRSRPLGSSYFRALLDEETTRWAPGTVRAGTRPLFSTSLRDGLTLLDALHRIATGALLDSITGPPGDDDFLAAPPHGREDRSDAVRRRTLGALIREVARPDEGLNQSNRDTCFAACMFHRLARVRPAEYARIAGELLRDGRGHLQNGDAFAPPDDAFAFDGSRRSACERLTQSALSDYWSAGPAGANPHRPRYHNTNPHPARTTGNPSEVAADRWAPRFIDSWERQAPTAQALLGQRFTVAYEGEVARMRRHLTAHPDVPLFAGLTWGYEQRSPHSRRQEFAHEIEIVAVDPLDQPHPRIHYWNPWGARTYTLDRAHPLRVESGDVERQGEAVRRGPLGPARRSDDDMQGLQSMTVQEFDAFSIGILFPEG